MRGFTAILLAAAFATPALAQVETLSPAPDSTAVVIYRDQPVDTAALMARANQPWNSGLDREGLALIVERRVIDLPAGDAVIRFRGVATGIVPQTATLDGLPADVLERNTDFDLLSPGSLLNRSVGDVVRVVRTNPATGERVIRPAVVRSGSTGTVLEVDGKLEALGCSGLTERIIFDRLPEGLSDQPVLSVRTRAPTAGRYTVTLAYLATGLQWSADYVARLSPDGRSLDLTGWITLANFSGTGFSRSPVQVVAGTLNRDADTRPVDPVEVMRETRCWPQDTTTSGPFGPTFREDRVEYAAPPMMIGGAMVEDIVVTGSRVRREKLAAQGELGDYKIYTLPELTDVNARQTKQVRFLEQSGVRFTRLYRHEIDARNEEEPVAPALLLRLKNDKRDGLGVPLPGGGVSLIERQAGHGLLTGQARFNDRGIGLPVELEFGRAMDLTVEHSLEGERTVGNKERVTVSATVSNDKPEAVEIELAPAEAGRRGFRIVSSDVRAVITDAGVPAWRLRVPAGQSRTLRYTLEWDD
ncbi:MAG: DUF4139 domain-containing protein [Brevundimonas sp.]|uniref:DUF4139 domain-containing protein n=1 Tax=Brevundimonas sp. TaxID=1871086 RepID=UPI0040339FDE